MVNRSDTRRTRIPSFLVLSIVLVTLSGCGRDPDWVAFRGEQGQGATRNAVYPPIGTKWKLRLQDETLDLAAFNPPVVKGDTIYFGSADGNFYALDVNSGYMRWVFETRGPINSVPYADEQNVYFGSVDGNAYAVRRSDGELVWSFLTGRPVRSSVKRYKDLILFASDGGATFALDTDGREVFRLPNPIWYYITFQVYEDIMYFAPGPPTQPRSLAAYHIKDQEYLWTLDTAMLTATWYSFPALHRDMLFMATGATRSEYWELTYYGLNRHTGEILWQYRDYSRFPPGYPVDHDLMFYDNLELLDYMAPAVWRDTVIFTSGDAMVRAFDMRTGELNWEKPLPFPAGSAPTVAGDRVYFGMHGDPYPDGAPPRLIALSARNGREVWRMDLDGAILSAPVIAGKWIMFGTDTSVFYILEELL